MFRFKVWDKVLMSKLNILMISTNPGSLEPKSGGPIRFYHLLKQLASRNNVMVLEPRFHYSAENKDILKKFFFSNYRLGKRSLGILADFNIDYIAKLIGILKTERVDIISVYSFRGIIAAKILIKLLKKKIPLIYDAHNVYYNIAEYTFKNEKLIARLFFRAYVPFIERIAVKCADRIMVVSNEDKREFIRLYKLPTKKIIVVPSGVDSVDKRSLEDVETIRKRFGIRSNQLVCIFHGWYGYFPNREATDLITSYVAPQIMKDQHDTLFVVAGPDVPVERNANVRLIGFVEEIYSLIQASDIAIVPLIHGSGTRLKILDYMIMGKAIVTTKKGIEGIKAENWTHAAIVDKVDHEFIEGILHLISSPDERERIGRNARELAIKEYSWDKIGSELDRFLRENVG